MTSSPASRSSRVAASDALAAHWSYWPDAVVDDATATCLVLDLDALASDLDPVATSELEASLARLTSAGAATSNTAERNSLLNASGPLGGSSGSVDAGDSAPTDRRPTDSNSSRRRVKQELDFLRTRVDELQETLSELQTARDTSEENLEVADGTTRAVAGPWEGIAAHQRAMRERAEQENVRLRVSLQAQLRLAKSLERLLRKRPSLWTNDGHPSKRANSFRPTGSSSSDDTAIFERLLASIEHGYASYRSALAKNGLLDAPCGHRSTTATRTTLSGVDGGQASSVDSNSADLLEGGESVCVELVDVKQMPFEMRETSDAAWRIITSGYMQLQHEVYRGFEGANDTLAISYSLTMVRKRLSVDFTARAVMKRFVEEDERVVFVWESLADTDGSHCVSANGKRAASGIQVHERGWTVFEHEDRSVVVDSSSSHTSSLDSGGDVSSRIRTCMQMTPLVSSATSNVEDESRQVGLLSSLSLDYFGPQLDQAHHAIETLLLDERMQRKYK